MKGAAHYDRSDYNARCIKIAQLYDNHGVEPYAIRERFGIQQEAVWKMITIGRKLIKGKDNAVSNSARGATAGTVSS